MIVTKDPCPFLRAREWVRKGAIWDALRPLLGNGLILAQGEEHVRQRAQIGNALSRIPRADVEAAVASVELPAPGERVDVAELMTRIAEHVMRRLLFGAPAAAEIGPAIRAWLRLFPLRLLGLPVGRRHLRTIDRALAALPRPAWMPEDLGPAQTRHQLATLYVAGVETTAAAMTWAFLKTPQPPLRFLPRRHEHTGENAILLLSVETMFGAGPRKCIGKQLAEQVQEVVLELVGAVEWRPVLVDARPRLGLTNWPRAAVFERI